MAPKTMIVLPGFCKVTWKFKKYNLAHFVAQQCGTMGRANTKTPCPKR